MSDATATTEKAPVLADGAEDDSKVFLEGEVPRRVKTIGGEDHDIPRCSFGREMTILKLIGQTIGAIATSGIMNEGVTGDDAAARILTLIFSEAPERLAGIAAAICGESADWVGENLDSESVLELILPFLKHRQTRIVAAVARHTGNLQAAVKAVQALTPKAA